MGEAAVAQEQVATAPASEAVPADEKPLSLGPSLALGATTPSSGGLFTDVYGLVDVRLVIALRVAAPLAIRIEPGTTMSWNRTNEFTLVKSDDFGTAGTSGAPDASHTVRVHSVGARALAAVDLASRSVFLAGGGSVSYGGASTPDACGGETRGGIGFGGIVGGGFRPDAERRLEIGLETGVHVYPFVDKCSVERIERTVQYRLQENPELAFALRGTWFVF